MGYFSVFLIIIQKQELTIPDVIVTVSQQQARTPYTLQCLKAVEISRIGHRHFHLNNCNLFFLGLFLCFI